MEQLVKMLDAAVLAAGLATVYNADDWGQFESAESPSSDELPPPMPH